MCLRDHRCSPLTFEHQFVVEQALDRLEEEGVERQVADLLALEVAVRVLKLWPPAQAQLQLREDGVVLAQVGSVQLRADHGRCQEGG